MVEWELMGRDRSEMAGDITLHLLYEVLWQSVLAVAEPVILSVQFNSIQAQN